MWIDKNFRLPTSSEQMRLIGNQQVHNAAKAYCAAYEQTCVDSKKRVVLHGKDKYSFSNVEGGMLIEKNDEELAIYPGFEYGDNLDDDYLIELAEEYEQDGQPIDVNSPLYASSSLDSNGGKTDLLQYPVHANSKNMYLLSGDIIHFLSDNVNDLTNIQWMNNDDQSIDVEGPIIASWLVLIQAHAERGCSDCNISWVKPIESNLEMINNHSLSISSVTIETLINWKIQQ